MSTYPWASPNQITAAEQFGAVWFGPSVVQLSSSAISSMATQAETMRGSTVRKRASWISEPSWTPICQPTAHRVVVTNNKRTAILWRGSGGAIVHSPLRLPPGDRRQATGARRQGDSSSDGLSRSNHHHHHYHTIATNVGEVQRAWWKVEKSSKNNENCTQSRRQTDK